MNENDIFKFSEVFKKVCRSNVFFNNLEKHKSFFGKKKVWKEKCSYFKKEFTNEGFKNFLVNNFKFVQINSTHGLLTGYYEPVIKVSRTRNNVFKFPILKKNKVYNKKARKFIEENFEQKDVILWTNDEIDLFFLHIQGSGIGEFQDKKKIKIAYSGNNDLNYTSIGRVLLRKKKIDPENVNLFSIKDWLRQNPAQRKQILNANERYIFFKELDNNISTQPVGSLGVQLTPDYSIAVDKNIYPLGLPFLIRIKSNQSIIPAVSMDTGSAIVGSNRADLFLGRGNVAEQKAGMLKKKIYLHAFIPYSK